MSVERYGVRTRKPKDDSYSYSYNTCLVLKQDNEDSKFHVLLFNSFGQDLSFISSKSFGTKIKSYIGVRKFVHKVCGGTWKWHKLNKKFTLSDYQLARFDNFVSALFLFEFQWENSCLKGDKLDVDVYRRIKRNVLTTLMWFGKSIVLGIEQDIKDCISLANICLDDMTNFNGRL